VVAAVALFAGTLAMTAAHLAGGPPESAVVADGGEDGRPTTTPLRDAGRFDLDVKSVPVAPIGGRRDSAGAVAGGRLVVWGGAHGDGPAAVVAADGARYDPAHGTWQRLAESPLSARAGHVAVPVDDSVVFWGGASRPSGAGDLLDGARYDVTTDSWQPLSDAPAGSGRSGAAATVVGDHLVIGGGGSQAGAFTASVLLYDLVSDRWRQVSTDGGVVDVAAAGDVAVVAVVDRSSGAMSYLAVDPGTGQTTAQRPAGRVPATFGLVGDGDTVISLRQDGDGVRLERLSADLDVLSVWSSDDPGASPGRCRSTGAVSGRPWLFAVTP
jgi:hypothetical protein